MRQPQRCSVVPVRPVHIPSGKNEAELWAMLAADDGSALVSAHSSDLWQARQILLRYREHCRVLEPPELVAVMRASVEQLAALYRTPGEPGTPVE